MKKFLFTTSMIFLTFITNAQELDGKWSLEKMKISGTVIYFDDTNRDKENLIKTWIKIQESEMDKDEKDEIAEMKKQVNSNKDLIYANAKDQFKNNIEFKEGKLIFKYLNNDDKMEKTEADINRDGDILKLYGVRKLHHIYSFKFLVKTNKLILTEIDGMAESDEELTVFFYEKK